jgi:hypothetical protein
MLPQPKYPVPLIIHDTHLLRGVLLQRLVQALVDQAAAQLIHSAGRGKFDD